MHPHASFVFILNGGISAPGLPPDVQHAWTPDGGILEARKLIDDYRAHFDNQGVTLRVILRPNTCYDLGAYGDVLTTPVAELNMDRSLNLTVISSKLSTATLYNTHTRFILVNASVRGPFLPLWSSECWSDAYLRALDSLDWRGRKVKMVGMTMNCVTSRPRHVQSMVLALDHIGLGVLLGIRESDAAKASLRSTTKQVPTLDSVPTDDKSGLNMNEVELEKPSSPSKTVTSHPAVNGSPSFKTATDSPRMDKRVESTTPTRYLTACPTDYLDAVALETSLTDLLLSNNYSVSTMFALGHSTPNYIETCTNDDVNAREGWYEGSDLHPWETMFIKTRWGVNGEWVEKLSGWLDAGVGVVNVNETRRGRSWDYC